MKTKQELKKYFENGDIPVQEEFWEWQNSYWHKDEKLPLNSIDYDFSQKADTDASNLNLQNIQLWKDKIETQTSIQSPELNGNILTVFYTGENGVQQSKSVDLSELTTNEIHLETAEYDASQNIITITQNNGSSFDINLSEFSIIPATNSDGSVALIQEGLEKIILKKVAVSGSYNDLADKPVFVSTDSLQNVINRGNTTTKPIIFNKDLGRAGELGFNKDTYSYYWGNINHKHTGVHGLGIGYNTLSKLTTGSNNVALGSYALTDVTTGRWNTATGISSGAKLTTGDFNAFFGTQAGAETSTGTGNTYVGDEAGNKNIAGANNTALGIGAGYALTNGSKNTFLGAFSGTNHGKATGSGTWNNNTFIGYNAASTTHEMGVWGDNNVVIGCNAPLGGSASNKLVIDSYTTPQRHDLATPFILGDFVAKTLNFDAVITAKRTPLADSSYSKVAVMNANNTIGYKHLSDFQNFLPITGTEVNKPISGHIQFEHANGEEYETLLYKTNNVDGIQNQIGFFPSGVMITSGTLDYILQSKVEVGQESGVLASAYGAKVALNGTGASLMNFYNHSQGKGIIVNNHFEEPVLVEHQTTNPRGLGSKTYFGDHAQENDYIQKQYADRQHSYSTEEKPTGGIWIDGKPVYKKTIIITQVPGTGEIDLKPELPDLETIISNEMFTEWSDLKAVFAGNQWRAKVYITIEKDMAKIELMNEPDYDYSAIDSFTLTLEYTKK